MNYANSKFKNHPAGNKSFNICLKLESLINNLSVSEEAVS